MAPNEDENMIENTSNVAVGGDQLLSELGRMLKENADYKQRNESLEEEIRQLRRQQQQQPDRLLDATKSDENDTISPVVKQQNNTSAALQDQILALHGKNQASQQILASTKAENEKLLEKIVQLSAENMILKDQIKQEEESSAVVSPPSNNAAHDDNLADSAPNREPSSARDDEPTTTTATVEELQDTIEHLQQRLMHQVEEKLILQTKVETLEQLLIEEKDAFKSIIESSAGNMTSTLPKSPQQTPRQADIIREALQRKKSKNLRTRMSTKVYNSNDQKIDVQAYQQLYEQQLKQKRLEQRIQNKPAPPQAPANHEYKPVSTAPPPPSSQPTVQTTELNSVQTNEKNGENNTTPLNKIGTQHITARLWDFDDWEVQNNSSHETKG